MRLVWLLIFGPVLSLLLSTAVMLLVLRMAGPQPHRRVMTMRHGRPHDARMAEDHRP